MAAPDTKALLLRAVREIKGLKAQLAEAEAAPAQSPPIAIVGMACRLPGAPSVEAFWRLLVDEVDALTEIPRDRFDLDAHYDPDHKNPRGIYVRRAGFVSDFNDFDPRFFGISPREALQMDPQQRVVLDTAYAALEDAAIAPGSLAGSPTGVYVGYSMNEYANRLRRHPVYGQINSQTGTSNAHSVVAGRVSYVLGL
ncbi:MAG: polyketide synthase, partial [Myxococcales bacterium]|nr:polyketide synthase [Myxococcales bacterium]